MQENFCENDIFKDIIITIAIIIASVHVSDVTCKIMAENWKVNNACYYVMSIFLFSFKWNDTILLYNWNLTPYVCLAVILTFTE